MKWTGYTYTCILHVRPFFRFSSRLVHHRPLSWVPCAKQQVLISYLFYTVLYICFIVVYVCQSHLPICPTPPPTAISNHVCGLHLRLYFHFANKCICTIFLDSTYKRYTIFVVFLTSLYMTMHNVVYTSVQLCEIYLQFW